ncbi:MAG: hypothetical protein M1434_01885 [Chloroflexi bacterium]|nr:hypothetical protein [Chloroflexota bacterium]MCL5273479.1 hypothetical protein [Chloroflexota bacterium]
MTNQTEQQSGENVTLPSPQTLFRIVGLRKDFDKTLQSVYRATSAQPTSQEGAAFQRIVEATSATDVVRLASLSRGVAQLVWVQRMTEFGDAAVPAIVRRLKSSQSIFDEDERHIVVERLIGALKRLGTPGGQALLDCFNNLDDYCQSLAAVTLGVLNVEAARDAIWRFFQRVRKYPQPDYLVGALWGLLDLQHPQADEVMAELMNSGRFFAEQYPLAALGGGTACVQPLIRRLSGAIVGAERYKDERDDILLALAAIGHRLGLEAYRAVLNEYVKPEQTVNSIVDVAVQNTPERIAGYFKMYFAPIDLPEEAVAGGS